MISESSIIALIIFIGYVPLFILLFLIAKRMKHSNPNFPIQNLIKDKEYKEEMKSQAEQIISMFKEIKEKEERNYSLILDLANRFSRLQKAKRAG